MLLLGQVGHYKDNMDKQKELVINLLSQILQDNLGNRLTYALAHGLIQHLDQELTKAVAIENAKANGNYFDMPDAIIVKDPQTGLDQSNPE